MKINWFCPLPPAKTEIANYSASLLPFLESRAELSLWTDQKVVDKEFTDKYDVNFFSHKKIDMAKMLSADINVYTIGNNPDFHSNIWKLSREASGVVVLHDGALQNLFLAHYTSDSLAYVDEYRRAMRQYHGTESDEAVDLYFNHKLDIMDLALKYPLTALAAENAAGVVAHNPAVFDNLKSKVDVPLCYVSLPGRHVIRERSRVAAKPYKLVVFGFLYNNRRLIPTLTGLSMLDNPSEFHLNIYGEVGDREEVLSHIEKLKLTKNVTLHGFVSDEVLQNGLADSDLAINLRFPSMGEVSSAQLLIFSHGLPSLVTKTGWYEFLPPSAVVHIDPTSEESSIAEALQAFLNSPEDFATMGAEGQALLSGHDQDEYAETIVEFCRKCIPWLAGGEMNRMGRSCAETYFEWGLDPDRGEKLMEVPAAAIRSLCLPFAGQR